MLIGVGTVHFWISVVLESMGQAGLSDFLGRFPLLGRIFMKVNPGWLAKLAAGSAKHESYTVDLINRFAKLVPPSLLHRQLTII